MKSARERGRSHRIRVLEGHAAPVHRPVPQNHHLQEGDPSHLDAVHPAAVALGHVVHEETPLDLEVRRAVERQAAAVQTRIVALEADMPGGGERG